MPLRDYQSDSIHETRKALMSGKRAPLIVQPCGCHALGHPILMHDGTIKLIEHVEVGDKVMGPDSNPRTVRWTHDGFDEMYRVIPKKGRPFVVNAGHVFSLRNKTDVRNVSVRGWLKQSRNFRNLFKLYRVPVEYPERKHVIPPYVLGVLIGDGCLRRSTSFCTPDREIVDAVEHLLAGLASVRHTPSDKCPVYRIVTKTGAVNPVREEIKRLGLDVNSPERCIPHEYLIDSAENRAQLLAGLLDTDGSYDGGGYDYITVSDELARDVEQLSRSLGFWSHHKACQKTWQGGTVRAYRMGVSGELDQIPCQVERKQAAPRRQIKDPLVCGFDLEPIGRGRYRGFHLDGDHLYVDGDYMVHHNTGKTHVAADIIRSSQEKGKTTIFIAPRRELIYQATEKIEEHGLRAGMIMAGEPRDFDATVQVASFDTLWSRHGKKQTMLGMPHADLVIIDEAHLSIAPTRKKMIDHYLSQGAFVIGLTATPARGDGRGLGEIYDAMIQSRETQWFIDNGHLVDADYWSPSRPDLEALKVRAGDYVIEGLAAEMDQPQLVGDIVSQWLRIAPGKSTVVFCVNRKHSRHIRDEFLKHGVKAEHLDGETPLDEREAILRRVESGETTVLSNVFVATYGLDIPSLEVAVLARPTKNIALYQQTLGRVMRPSPGKEKAIVIDHAGAVEEHGLFSDPVPWTLNSRVKVQELKKEQAKEKKEPKDITCSKCSTVFRSAKVCPKCGHQMIPETEEIPYHESDLVQTKGKDKGLGSVAERQRFYAGLKYHCQKKGYMEGWAAHAYKEKVGNYPDRQLREVRPKKPDAMTAGWIRYLQIRNAKRKHT